MVWGFKVQGFPYKVTRFGDSGIGCRGSGFPVLVFEVRGFVVHGFQGSRFRVGGFGYGFSRFGVSGSGFRGSGFRSS